MTCNLKTEGAACPPTEKKIMPAVRRPAGFFRSRSHRIRTGRLARPHHESNRNARGSASTSASVAAVVTQPASPARPRAAADAPPRQRHSPPSGLPEPETRVQQSLGPREPVERYPASRWGRAVTSPAHLTSPVYNPPRPAPFPPAPQPANPNHRPHEPRSTPARKRRGEREQEKKS